MEKILDKQRLDDWIAALTDWEAFAPAVEDGVWAFRPVVGAARLDHPNTKQPPKGFAFPQREVFFSFEQIKGEAPRLTQKLPDSKHRVVFGVRPCDARGTVRMDRVFADHVDDVYYQSRRNNMAYVGLACNKPPSAHCFCLSVGGSPVSSDGLDVLMTDLGDRYFLAAITETGKSLMTTAGDLLKMPAAADRKQAASVHAEAVAQPQRAINNPDGAPARLKASFKSPLWEELAQACIGCGICTFLCPTCHCFDINDEVTGSAPLKGNRVRTWDNCQFPDFTMHTSGHNPRPTVGARLRQRVCHKFQYFHENFGMHQCTGCGRCISDCPVGIDIVHVVNKVTEHAG
ncbi:MAG: sulfite reductase [Hydrogenophilales bacterium CG03_land_8_20_14_0_80_62_28]|nr:sulfite reductase [Betaproteobacteria bacterium]OIO79825.1 MAG: sulfite reductase [Hydrogenophilaceae bacterium CG1_02_62_390]PIV24326.1 MAG: sulfite reductase [Hydrogenophilales bacterium CG03_land_8_20_14_0_80_62_28]PIW38422.1 MAG: sulfite reductase [Hydrogenophilales bacterium CG15_BIG_FIL_POST_REV_8_21_14_020_62_31]PIW71869.1 MAG: sulfite reductase [Hydrogenophilales bacterium CG12_big_fil_rev_8_21_14_0_65_61_21]PIX01431.1 MAG: sulfite reductase [Hydrogenophilales bacterium CG_4_8_14_3_